jgi:hypothetical protein
MRHSALLWSGQWNQYFEIRAPWLTFTFNQSLVLLHKGLRQIQTQT